jgi:hypothetical protein
VDPRDHRGGAASTSALDVELGPRSVSDPDFEAWSHALPALEAMLAGRPGEAIAGYRRAIPLAVQQVSDARVGLIRAAHWARDLEAAREGLREAEAETYGGRYIDAERALGRAGVAPGGPEGTMHWPRSASHRALTRPGQQVRLRSQLSA